MSILPDSSGKPAPYKMLRGFLTLLQFPVLIVRYFLSIPTGERKNLVFMAGIIIALIMFVLVFFI